MDTHSNNNTGTFTDAEENFMFYEIIDANAKYKHARKTLQDKIFRYFTYVAPKNVDPEVFKRRTEDFENIANTMQIIVTMHDLTFHKRYFGFSYVTFINFKNRIRRYYNRFLQLIIGF